MAHNSPTGEGAWLIAQDGVDYAEVPDRMKELRVGTRKAGQPVPVSQAFCSALPIGYSTLSRREWEPFARLGLEATYEATLLAAAEQANAGGSNTALLTRVGGGVFGNDPSWIDHAIERALRVVEHAGLDIRIVGYRGVDSEVQGIIDRWVG